MIAEDRLGRIDDKLDKLAETVPTLARLEERTITLFKHMAQQDSSLVSLTLRVDNLERVFIQRSVVMGLLDKTFWLVAGGGIAAVSARFF